MVLGVTFMNSTQLQQCGSLSQLFARKLDELARRQQAHDDEARVSSTRTQASENFIARAWQTCVRGCVELGLSMVYRLE